MRTEQRMVQIGGVTRVNPAKGANFLLWYDLKVSQCLLGLSLVSISYLSELAGINPPRFEILSIQIYLDKST